MEKPQLKHTDHNVEVRVTEKSVALSRDGSGYGPKEPLNRKTLSQGWSSQWPDLGAGLL